MSDESVKTFCPSIKHYKDETHQLNIPWFFGTFTIGICLGGIIAIIMAYKYKNKLTFKKRHSEEDGHLNETKPLVVSSETNIQLQNIPEKSESKRYLSSPKATCSPEENLATTNYHRGMADVLLQKNSETIEEETSWQNVERVEKFVECSSKDKEQMMLICLQKILTAEQKNGEIPGHFSVDYFITEINNNVQNIKMESQRREADTKVHKEREKIFRKDEDEFYLEFEQKRASKKIARQYQKEMKKIGKKLLKENVDSSVIDRINNELSKIETEIAVNNDKNQKEMMQSLNSRQIIRQTAAEKKLLKEKEEKEIVENTVSLISGFLEQLVSSGEISDRQNKQLLDDFKMEMFNKKKQLDNNATQELATLTNSLNQKRNDHLQKLEETHQNLKKQHFEDFQKERSGDLDANLQQLSESHAKQLQEVELTLLDSIKMKGNFKEKDLEKLQSQKEEIQQKISESKESFRKEQASLLNEKMEKRRKEKEEQKQKYELEHQVVVQQQTAIVAKMLESNGCLDDEKKSLILKEHQQKIIELGNQMELSRLKYEQSLHIQLNQRRNKLKEIKEQKRNGNNKISDQKLESEIKAAEEKLQTDKEAAVAKMKEMLQKETESLIEEQYEELIAKIGKLEVGQARRNVLLERQDRTIQKLQEKLGEQAINNKTPQNHVDHLVQRHQNNLIQLEEKHKATREHNEKYLQERIQQKHLKKKQMEDKIEEDGDCKELLQQKGVRVATSIFLHSLMDKRHKYELDSLEKSMKSELETHRKELYSSMKQQLNDKLMKQKQSFFMQLAAISDLTNEQVNNIIEETLSDIQQVN
ncbi:titin homolog [Argonauta hians]